MDVVASTDDSERATAGIESVSGGEVRVPRRRWPLLLSALVLGLLLFTTNTGLAIVAPVVVQLRLAAPQVFGSGTYQVAEVVNGQVAAFAPCRPLSVVINDVREPPGADGVVEQAVKEASEASGVDIRVVGTTRERPDPDRALTQSRYGQDWAPILIAWTGPDEIPQLAGSVIGRGGPRGYYGENGEAVYVTGHVFLDADDLGEELQEGDVFEVQGLVMHELGHVLGLDHVASPFELMSSRNVGLTQYGPGDLAGLKRLAQGPCAE